ncbi:MAG: UPF0182 family protein, partial [Actinomycetota bacterium]|nr:UPF0182 family protein [Actinomycetota bacterium]
MSKGRVRLSIGLVVAVFLVAFSRRIAVSYTDLLWFSSLDLTSVWWRVVGTKALLALVFGLIFLVVLFGNLMLADRSAPAFVSPGPEQDVIDRYRTVVGDRSGRLRLALVGFFTLSVGRGVLAQWETWLLFRNGDDFGVTDPQFGRDIGFFVFRLPFITFVTDWLFSTLALVTVIVAAAHYLNGGIRFQTPGQKVTPSAKMHLSVLFAVLALLRSVTYYFNRFELTRSTRGFVDGASYTDVNAQLPAITLLILVSCFSAGLLLYSIRRNGWGLPVTAIGLWIVVSLVVGALYPAFIQRFRVEPEESTREAEFIDRNIAATRAAMNLDKVTVRDFDYSENLTVDDLVRNEETIRNVRLWDPEILERTYQRLQEVRTFYRFTDVDVDRYLVDGRLTQIVLSARELNTEGLPADSWENRYLAFTHGFGAVLSPANAVTRDGQPDFTVRDVPPRGSIPIEQPRLYHGESLPGYAIVNTTRDEIDYPTEEGLATYEYTGDGGVDVSSILRKAAFALRFGDINPLISNFLTDGSRILYIRDIKERAEKVAPFLHFDADPYPVIDDGRIIWVLDAYTTTDRYPYAQRVGTARQKPNSGLRHGFNYARNSVKVAIDSYDGDVTLYLVDDDPIARAYQKAFPDLFEEEVPESLREHFRYPEDLFRAQTDVWSRYHISGTEGFYSQSDAWNVAQDPGTDSGAAATAAPTVDPVTGEIVGPIGERRMDPYYLLMRLPGEEREQFLMLQPYVPFSVDDTRRELSAFMVAKSDPDTYGELEVFVMPRGEPVDGPAIVNARIQQEPAISQIITLLSRSGSRVLQGNLVIIPIEESLLYVRPLYVEAEGTSVPELKQVIVAYGRRVVMRDTLQDALRELFGDAPETLEEGLDPDELISADDDEPDDIAAIDDLLSAASEAFDDAELALRDGDLAEYQRLVNEAERLVSERPRAAGLTAPETD